MQFTGYKIIYFKERKRVDKALPCIAWIGYAVNVHIIENRGTNMGGNIVPPKDGQNAINDNKTETKPVFIIEIKSSV